MRNHGVEGFVDPVIDANGRMEMQVPPDDPDLPAAQAACSSLLPNEEFRPPDQSEMAELQQHALDFARCMRKHGIDFPDPVLDGNGMVRIDPGHNDINAPDFKAADQACNHLLQTGGSPVGAP